MIQQLLQRYTHYLALAVLVAWNTWLVWYRMVLTDKRWFVFFLWNLALAIVPFLCSDWALFFARKHKKWAVFLLVLVSVLFLPNAPYIITDLFHLRVRAEMPLWYDTMILFSMALSGLVLYYAAVFNLLKVFRHYMNTFRAEALIALIGFLCGYGIYLGRYLRFNSWDIVSNPNELLDEIADHLINTSVHTRTVGVTLLYGGFLWVGYVVVRLYQWHIRQAPTA